MARPKEFTDDRIFKGILAALGDLGYSKVTLSAVAKHVGISPAALIQRFSTKKELFLAFFDYLNDLSEQSLNDVKKHSSSSIAALREIALMWVVKNGDPIHCANIGSFYTDCISDPELREKAKKRLEIVDEGIQFFLNKGVDNGELLSCDVPKMSRILQSSITGALLLWATNSERQAEEWIQDCFDMVLGPVIVQGGK
ncbi:TetR/AcrR family transcriptional regulator [Bacillus horti]|uniref:AcrR family transcriptional regulator n=1 Tax=Caldalkalibacillus horti TaxID=77523 RepID=A0ABT9VZT5_9BACI|nr:TetR/AcrR family transcriptional regulator [Bacillus horti]MDQ0166506.1 AcrR family transcriptional regulator [Bacillus horti]